MCPGPPELTVQTTRRDHLGDRSLTHRVLGRVLPLLLLCVGGRVVWCRYSDFGLYHVAPVSPLSQVAYLGELGKWVPVASARTTAIHDSAAALAVSVVGVPKEKVELAFFDSRTEKVSTVLCVFGASGVASASSAGKCE